MPSAPPAWTLQLWGVNTARQGPCSKALSSAGEPGTLSNGEHKTDCLGLKVHFGLEALSVGSCHLYTEWRTESPAHPCLLKLRAPVLGNVLWNKADQHFFSIRCSFSSIWGLRKAYWVASWFFSALVCAFNGVCKRQSLRLAKRALGDCFPNGKWTADLFMMTYFGDNRVEVVERALGCRPGV